GAAELSPVGSIFPGARAGPPTSAGTRLCRFSRSFAKGGRSMRKAIVALVFWVAAGPLAAEPAHWRAEWPMTDFTRHSVDFVDIIPGGPSRDGIPSMDRPAFVPVADAARPVIEP